MLTGDEIRAMIDRVYPLEQVAARAARDRRRSGASATARGEIGFINPVSEPFCADCNRIRLTAEGKLRTCLFSLHETDLRAPLRDGADDDELERLIRDAVWRKELKHRVAEPGFRQPPRTMSQIGGLEPPCPSQAGPDRPERDVGDSSEDRPGCAATAAGRRTWRPRSTTTRSCGSTPRPAASRSGWTRSRRPWSSAWTACTTSRT